MSGGDEQSALDAAQVLASSCADVIGAGLLSVVLHGSLAAGGFRPGRSDLDVLLVVAAELTDGAVARLEQVVRTADAGSASGTDLHVVTAQVASSPTAEPMLELHVGRHAGDVEVTRRTPDADLVTELSMARADGRAIVGMPASRVIAPVPPAWVDARSRHWLTTWQSRTDDTANAAFMVLTACRMWRFAVERVHSSKTGAGRWALDRDPTLGVVRQALRQYADDAGVSVEEHAIADLLVQVLHETPA
jgi:hypothetical protein